MSDQPSVPSRRHRERSARAADLNHDRSEASSTLAVTRAAGHEALTSGEGAALRTTEIEHAVAQYLEIAQGNPATALTIAIADLLDACAEADLRRWALDQWTSRGYVRGRASTILAVQHAARDRPSGSSG